MTIPSSVTASRDATYSAAAVAAAVADVDGVHALGRSVERASSALRESVGLAGRVPGVDIELDRGGPARVAVSIVVDYPHKLHDVTGAVRTAALRALDATGRDRVDVDVRVTDVWGPFDTEPVEGIDDEPGPDASVAGAASDDATSQTPDDGGVGPRRVHAGHADAIAPALDRDPAHPDDADEVVAEALSEVAEAVAQAAEHVRSDRRAD